ncbi:TonB-dependent receptor plug domain-containing protein [Maricaulis sp. CAU 1757]
MRSGFSGRLVLASSALLGVAGGALAEELPGEPDDVVYVTAARVALTAEDVTASVTRLDAAELEARGTVFVTDALRAVPGLAISRSGPAGSLTQVRARGAEANHVLVLIDGIEASNPFSGNADFAHFAFDDLAAIEVARGEQSALWGADAIGGVIRLTSRRPEGPGTESSARLEGGSFDTFRASAGLTTQREQGWLSLSVSTLASGGIDTSGLDGERDGYDQRTLHAAAQVELSQRWQVEASVRALAYKAAFDSDTDWDGRLDDVDRQARGETLYARLALSGEQTLGGVTLSHEAALQRTGDVARGYADGARTQRAEGARLQVHYLATGRWSTGGIEHRLSGLVEQDRDTLSSFAGAGDLSNQDRTLERAALALDYGAGRGPLDVTLSVRREANDGFADATTWRVGAAWAVAALDGRVRASIGEGVKNPGIYELYGFFPDFFQGNPGLVPERSRGWELGWDQSLSGGRAELSVVYFASELEDEIYSDFASFPATARNRVSVSQRHGVELAGRWAVSDAVSLMGAWTQMRSEENGVAEIRRPDSLGSLTLDWSPQVVWSGALTVDHVGAQTDTDFATFTTVRLPAYTLVGGQLRWAAGEALEVYVRGTNLLDEEYQDVVGYATPGRGLYFGLRYRG